MVLKSAKCIRLLRAGPCDEKVFLVSRSVHAGFLPGADIDTITAERPVSDLTQNAKTWGALMGGGHFRQELN